MMDISQTTAEIDIDQIVRDLDVGTGVFPEESLRAAQRHSKEITPRLIEAIRHATREQADGRTPTTNVAFFAVYLLAEFNACEALPSIVEVLSLPGDGPFDLLGDGVLEDVARILAVLAADQPDVVDSLIANRNLNVYVRWEAVQTYGYWLRDGRMPREAVVARLGAHLDLALDGHDSEFADMLVCELACFGLREFHDQVAAAYERGMIGEDIIDRESALKDLSEVEIVCERMGGLRPTEIGDTVEALRTWACFRPENARLRTATVDRQPAPVWPAPVPQPDGPRTDWQPTDQIRREAKAGRNDPCPCGSGKKFKKCCGSPGRQ